MSSYTWQGNQYGHVGDIGYAANYSPSGTPGAGDSVSDSYGSATISTGTSVAYWSLSQVAISGGTFNGSVTTTQAISGGTFNSTLSVLASLTNAILTNCTSLRFNGVTFKPHASSFGLTAGNLLYGQTVDDVVGTLHEAATTDVRHGTQYGAGGTAHTGSAWIPAAASVLSGVNVDATTGTVTEAATTDVRHGTHYGAGGTAHSGTCYVPIADNVVYSVPVDATTGTLSLPHIPGYPVGTCQPWTILNTARFGPVSAQWPDGPVSGTRTDCPAAQALIAASYGDPGNPTAGTVSEAAATDVRHGAQYGAGGNAHTGSAYIPAAGDVRHGVNVDATTGTAYIPAAANVRDGTNVDATTGTLVSTDPGQACVLSGVSYEINSASKTGTLAFLAPQDVADAMKLAPTSGQPAAGSVMGCLADRTGYKLAPDGLDAVDTTAPTGPAANFRQMLVQLWRRFFKKAILDHEAGTLVTYADDSASVLTTQVASETDQVETQGPAT
jgi:hypothetical protein